MIMKKLIIYLVALIPLLTFQACKEDTLNTYLDSDGGNNIYFYDKFMKNNSDIFMKAISLGLAPVSVTDSVIGIVVQTTGAPMDYHRKVNIQLADTSTMLLGTHFDFVEEPIVRAGMVRDTIKLKLHRTADLLTKRVYLNLKLVPNENFNTEIGIKVNNKIEQDILSYEFYLDDLFPVPYLWTTFAGKNTVIAFWGPYSRKKVELMLEILKADPSVFYDSKKTIGVGTLVNWASYMKFWLNKEKSEGRIYYDDEKKEITMGNSAT